VSCAEVQSRLAEAVLSRASVGSADRRHAERCAECGAELGFLKALGAALDAVPEPSLSEPALANCKFQALRALRARRVPAGFGRALARALAPALLALPLIVGHAWLVARGASALLGSWLPEAALLWLAGVYFGSLALGLGTLYGSIPVLVALAQQRRLEERA
jgi:hypothetical protein